MYSFMVDILLVTLIVALAAALFLGSLMLVLLDAGSQAVGRVAVKYAHSLAQLAWQASQSRLELHRASARVRAQL